MFGCTFLQSYSRIVIEQYSCTMLHLCSRTVVQLFSCKVVQLYRRTGEQLYSCTVVQLYSCTDVQLFRCTVVQLYSFTVVQLSSCPAVQLLYVMHFCSCRCISFYFPYLAYLFIVYIENPKMIQQFDSCTLYSATVHFSIVQLYSFIFVISLT